MELNGMQDFWVSLAGARRGILPSSIDKKSTFILPSQAVPAAHDSILSVLWAWPGVGEPRQRWEPWEERQPPLAARELKHVERGRARGCSQQHQQHPFPAGVGRAEAQEVPVSVKEARKKGQGSSWKGWRERNLLW